MSYQKTIVCDVDGVVASLLPAWLARYEKDFDHKLTNEDITAWDLKQFVKPECGVKIFDYLHDKTLYDEVLPIPGALAGIEALRELGYRIVFGTASNSSMSGRKLHWLEEHGFLTLLFGSMSYDYVELNDKRLLSGSACAIIDDYPKNLKGFLHPVLFRQPHNHLGCPDEPMTEHADGWTEVVAYFKNVTENQAFYL